MIQAHRRGRFISLEGMEGAGKSTNLAFVRSWLGEFLTNQRVALPHDPELHTTREPGGTALAESIRDLLIADRTEPVAAMTEVLLMFAARAQHVARRIRPALDAGDWVVSDRFVDASYAYQGGGRGLDWSVVEQLDALVVGDVQPDLTLFLDLSLEESRRRIATRALDRFEQEGDEFFQRVRKAYLRRAAQHEQRIVVIDASQPLDVVQTHIARTLEQATAVWLDC